MAWPLALFLGGGVGLVGLVFLLAWKAAGIALRGQRDPLTTTPATFGQAFSDEAFSSGDGVVLRGWFVPRPASSVTLIVCHGWGGNRSRMIERTHFLSSRGAYNLFYFDFRSHGESEDGRTSLSRYEIEDLEAAVRHVRSVHSEASARMGFYGMSMGASVCLWVAAKDPSVGAVAAESPFSEFKTAFVRYGRIFYHAPSFFSKTALFCVRWRLGFDPNVYAPVRVIDGLAPRPLFLLQGDGDVRTPPSEGRRLFNAAREPKTLWTVPGADHGQVAEVAGPEYQRRVLEFFAGAFRGF